MSCPVCKEEMIKRLEWWLGMRPWEQKNWCPFDDKETLFDHHPPPRSNKAMNFKEVLIDTVHNDHCDICQIMFPKMDFDACPCTTYSKEEVVDIAQGLLDRLKAM